MLPQYNTKQHKTTQNKSQSRIRRTTNNKQQTMSNSVCNRKMSFDECELAILRSAVDNAEKKHGHKMANSEEIKRTINIVEEFIKKKQLICYGGTAINNILPKESQFYNKDVEIPDYDFYSHNALNDAKELTDIYVRHGFSEVEAKSGQHHGTYKVFVNFIPVADITYIQKDLFLAIKRTSMRVGGILYAPPNWLRMNLYLELSRPDGDTSRWEKVLKRLTLLNQHFPLKTEHTNSNGRRCSDMSLFQRQMSSIKDKSKIDAIYDTVQQTFINEGVVFFGGYALTLYSHHMPKSLQHKLQKNPDFDVLAEDPVQTAEIVKERLSDIGVHHVKLIQRPSLGDIVAPHIEICVGADTIAFVYKPIACHSYNVIRIHNQSIKVATIDTMLSFWLVFLYANRPYYDTERILCMAKFLFDVQEKNRLSQRGLLKRFSISCVGHQQTVEEIRAEKSSKFNELKKKTNKTEADKREFEEWFLRYVPTAASVASKSASSKQTQKNKNKHTKTTKTTKTIKTKRNTNRNTKKNTNTNTKKNTTSFSTNHRFTKKMQDETNDHKHKKHKRQNNQKHRNNKGKGKSNNKSKKSKNMFRIW